MPIFARPDAAQIVLDSWRFLQRSQRMTIFGYVIMENHLHFIASSPDLAKEVGDFKSFTARRIIDELKNRGSRQALRMLKRFKARHKTDREYQLWQEGSKPKMIEGDEMMRQKLEYTHYNPVKRGYVDDPTHWRYSSARNYAGGDGLLSVVTDW
jgi:REP element-mobilizing transposase RayT